MTTSPTFQIPKDVLEPILQAHVMSAVAVALGDHSRILNAAVERALTVKVDGKGEPTTYNGEPFINYLVSKALREAVQSAVIEAVMGHKERVRAAVLAEMSRKNSPLVKQLVDGMIAGVFDPKALSYRLNVTLAGRES